MLAVVFCTGSCPVNIFKLIKLIQPTKGNEPKDSTEQQRNGNAQQARRRVKKQLRSLPPGIQGQNVKVLPILRLSSGSLTAAEMFFLLCSMPSPSLLLVLLPLLFLPPLPSIPHVCSELRTTCSEHSSKLFFNPPKS